MGFRVPGAEWRASKRCRAYKVSGLQGLGLMRFRVSHFGSRG